MSQQFKMKIDCGNAAFSEDAGYEVARILPIIAAKLCRGESGSRIMDVNGNHVGDWTLKEEVKPVPQAPKEMRSMGSFASYLYNAYTCADSKNKRLLAEAFPQFFQE